ncbi:UDP-N-acetylmuramate dehydrogenase [Silvimonas terrae]|uniref:UDP-N-acetylenolpyruvoylglucosamine reductase n=1 Tax=Silvimonas terrae TaxID=300266 RepID=A0A840RLD7_9NEIS|nr:UDP-N-acetylmuramate dehydrogenase [Silvimonas terrae]MBB5193300.1 UDP-N-acetylmuramate dehydrogenase [Silvimonas terrae]
MPLSQNTDLTALNTLGLPARAQYFCALTDLAQLDELRADPAIAALPWHVLGSGSNLVLPDQVTGLVIQVALRGRTLMGEDEHAWYVSAGAGENWHDFVQWTLAQGWAGLENLSLIPGTVGAAPIQNIGAYGVEVKDLLYGVHATELKNGERRIFSQCECRFGYRDSIFKQEEAGRWLISEVIFRLPKQAVLHTAYGDLVNEMQRVAAEPSAQAVAQAVIQVRQRKLPDPAVIGNAGSFFKNPVVDAATHGQLKAKWPELVSYPFGEGAFKLAAGWLIDKAGWKGKTLGPAGMYEKQALVLVNHGGAQCADVQRLCQAVQDSVRGQFGVQLEPEPVFW